MIKNERADAIRRRLYEYFRQSSNSYIRNALTISMLADELAALTKPDRTIWVKWNDDRERLVKEAQLCWIPLEDLVACLNAMPGPPLTRTDVAQRLRAFHEETCDSPNDALKAGCLEIFEREKAVGTEMIAIVGAIQEFVEEGEAAYWREQNERWRQEREDQRIALEQRLVSGADCQWTPYQGSKARFCRMNGRLYRSTITPEKRRLLERMSGPDELEGRRVGIYLTQGEATKALKAAAFGPDLL